MVIPELKYRDDSSEGENEFSNNSSNSQSSKKRGFNETSNVRHTKYSQIYKGCASENTFDIEEKRNKGQLQV